MAENSGIEWTNHTFNPWIGCTKVSPACDFCYAEEWNKRYEGGKNWGPKAPRRRTKTWSGPRKWNREAAAAGIRARVFCASLADVFDNHPTIEQAWRDDLWQLIRETPNLDWLLLTKRPQNIIKYLPEDWLLHGEQWGKDDGYPNVWLGTTVENQVEADRRIPHLLNVPSRVRFLSCEPLLGAVDLTRIALVKQKPGSERAGIHVNSLTGKYFESGMKYLGDWDPNGLPPLQSYERKLHWIISGGESGSHFRHADPEWFRSLRDQCAAADVPFLFKQWEGATQPIIKAKGRELDGVVHDGYPKVA